MDAAAIISAIETVIKLASQAVQLEQDVKPFAELIYNSIGGKIEVTQTDLDQLATKSDALSAELQAPLPPEDGAPV